MLEGVRTSAHKDADPVKLAEFIIEMTTGLNDPIPGITREVKMRQAESDSFAAFSAAVAGSRP